jgi:hypothetical protein
MAVTGKSASIAAIYTEIVTAFLLSVQKKA